MGTRSITYVYDDDGEMIMALYRQYDGYLSGMGKDLKGFLDDIVMVNGMMPGDERRTANGMGCLAAQLVAYFKEKPGNFYLYPPSEDIDAWQEYEYRIKNSSEGLKISVRGHSEQLYSGLVADFDPMKVEEDE